MARIACPGCKKLYSVPDTAAGQAATCKACGKKFRIGNARPKAAAKLSAKEASPTKSIPSKQPQPAATSLPDLNADDGFWDDEIPEPTTSVVSQPFPTPISQAESPNKSSKTKPKKKKKMAIRWGFDWGKVGGGLLTFLVASGITLGLMEATGRIYFWPAGVAVVGLFTALSGLMGEEGVW